MRYEYPWGIFISRGQPKTDAHTAYEKLLLKKCERGIIFVGSSNKSGEPDRNPFPIDIRMEMEQESIEVSFGKDAKRLEVIPLPDRTFANNDSPGNRASWGLYVFHAAFVATNGHNRFAYFSGEPLPILRDYFSGEGTRGNIKVIEEEPDFGHVLPITRSTRARQAIEDGEWELLSKICPPAVYLRRLVLQEQILTARANPRKDFSALAE